MENKIRKPDYKNCISNLPNSILKKWGLKTKGDTLPLADQFLEKDYKNVGILLLDGRKIVWNVKGTCLSSGDARRLSGSGNRECVDLQHKRRSPMFYRGSCRTDGG